MSNELRALLVSRLLVQGWDSEPAPALGSKIYATIVGPKRALAYLVDYGKDSKDVVVTGDYQSEGRNALSTCWVDVARDSDCENAAKCIDNHKAMALSSGLCLG